MDSFDRLIRQQNFLKHAVVISRHWENPQISVTVNQEKIEIVMQLDEFVKALVAEMDKPIQVMTRKSLRDKVANAANAVIEKTKQASSGVMIGG